MSLNQNINGSTKFSYVLCELHYHPIHGKTRDSCPTIDGHFLIIDIFDGKTGIVLNELENYTEYDTDNEDTSSLTEDEDYDEDDEENTATKITHIQSLYRTNYEEISLNRQYNNIPHKIIRNYHNIISQPNYIRPEIAECFVLPTLEYIAIIKTIWIRLIQRKWKSIFAERKQIQKSRMCLSSISSRQITGIWPKHCQILPGIKGMLAEYK